MTRPVRLQLSRRKGFRLQEVSAAENGLPAKIVGRPGPWGNPFGDTSMALMIAGDFTLIGRQKMFAADVFRLWLDGRLVGNRAINAMHRRRMRMLQGLPTLRGHNLACWCKPGMPCHADVLLELANQGDASRSGEEPR